MIPNGGRDGSGRLAAITMAIYEYLRGGNCQFVSGGPLDLQIEVSGLASLEDVTRLMDNLLEKVKYGGCFSFFLRAVKADVNWLPATAKEFHSFRPVLHHGSGKLQKQTMLFQVTSYSLESEFRLLVTLLPEEKA
ncbi:hypothetical protein A2480_01000 [Candidatus Uhrbacteria bacterium RIFOXYC2_FULL_47_19]|uniref:Uncharacterized protein n=1 Tax=Candidatus Uhrbacteria bacterium RIFOXYC2_FULL_47_19 TaxID=1802424 RepID=A0A1F7WCW0_9BACT|nr:MAG: hypothetical protein A2480_01000 [Candidatus Uhrbacteria bacterium RIFOXYC2_FULL_47_19]